MSMYKKEIDLTKAIEYTCKTVFDEIYYFENEDDEYAEGIISHLGDNSQLKEEFGLDDSAEYVFDITKALLDQGKTVVCLMGTIFDNSEVGEVGFDLESPLGYDSFEISYDQTKFETGGFGVYIKKIDDKYMCEYAIYRLRLTFPHGPADETFVFLTKEYDEDMIYKSVVKLLDELDMYI